MIYKIGWLGCKIFLNLMFRIRVVGRENIPQKPEGFILASNHRTNYDPPLVAIHFPQQVFFMAKVELFQRKLAGWVLRRLGAFPVERGKGDTGAIDWARNVVENGGVLGMFPEGHRSEDGKPLRPKSGTAMIAGQTRANVLPCAVCFGDKLKFRSPITIRYGKLIHAEDLGFTGDATSPREIKAASHMIMGKIIELLEEGV